MSDINQSTKQFYRDLPSSQKSFKETIKDPDLFQHVPLDWHVIVTDIKGSTKAFAKGKYEEVNITAAGSIIIGINVAKKNKTDIPFIYGGDGATLIVPSDIKEELLENLATLRKNVREKFELNLRVGSISVKELHEKKHALRIAKYPVSKNYHQAIFIDEGLYIAEHTIKNNFTYQTHKTGNGKPLDLEGLECKWNVIHPPKNKEEILCLIVDASKKQKHEIMYGEILSNIDTIYGSFEERHPVKTEHISSTLHIPTLRRESLAKFGYVSVPHIIRRLFENLAEKLGWSTSHKKLLTLATDTLKVDGTLKTIIAGSRDQRRHLISYLESEERRGLFSFGYYVTPSTTMTCFVEPRKGRYVNFIDGTDGGYIQAAKVLKKKVYNSKRI